MKNLTQTLFFFLLVTQICFAQWVQLGLDDKGIKDIAARNSNIFAVTTDSAFYRSTDNGINWSIIVDSKAIDIAESPQGSLFMVTGISDFFWEDSLYRSSDNGNTWVNITPSQYGIYRPTNITISPAGLVFCRLFTDGSWTATAIALSTDDGSTWTSPGMDIYGGDLFDFRGQNVITSGFRPGTLGLIGFVYLSSDNGQNWSNLGQLPWWHSNVLSMCSNGNILMDGSDFYNPGFFLSSDSCNTWNQVSTLIPEAGISIESGGVLVGTDSLGVFLFSDNGDSLGSRNDGLSNLNVHTLSIDNNGYVYLGSDNGVWRRPLSEITSVEEHSTTLPSSYILSQNYPNPFNPSTTIGFGLQKRSNVKITILNAIGEEVAVVLNEEREAGYHQVEFNATNLPSGVYFYQLKAGNYVEMKKMLLLK